MSFYQDKVKPEVKMKNVDIDFKGKSVIDLGANIGLVYDYVIERGAKSYMGIEQDKGWALEGKRRKPEMNLIHGDLFNYIPQACDVLLCLALFQHLDRKQIKKLLRGYKANELIVEVPVKGTKYHENYELESVDYWVDLLDEFYSVSKIVDSGYSDRKIFVCEK